MKSNTASTLLYIYLSWLAYHLKTVWLFTASDLKTIVGPKSAFGVIHALSASEFRIPQRPTSIILSRIPLTIFWCWINLLPFAIGNQYQDNSINEDRLNKPWRSLPSGRLSQSQARILMIVLYPIAVIASSRIGGLQESLILVVLGFLYNQGGGADVSCISRNLINGAGFVCYTRGAMETAMGTKFQTTDSLMVWFSTIFLIVSTSVHTQDMYDQGGDSLRQRKTVPLVIGDRPSRWTIAVSVGLWSFFCPRLFDIGHVYYMPHILGFIVAYRILTYVSVEDDKITFRLWNLWMVGMYLCPVVASKWRSG